MEDHWNILFYKTLQGDTPVNDFILSLEIKAQSKIKDSIKLLQEFGVRLGAPHIKKLSGTELWELRILGSDSIRIFYVAVTGKNFYFSMDSKRRRIKLR